LEFRTILFTTKMLKWTKLISRSKLILKKIQYRRCLQSHLTVYVLIDISWVSFKFFFLPLSLSVSHTHTHIHLHNLSLKFVQIWFKCVGALNLNKHSRFDALNLRSQNVQSLSKSKKKKKNFFSFFLLNQTVSVIVE